MGCVYLIINKINQKCYVGKTIKTLEKRWHGHIYSTNNSYFHRAIHKHGKESFILNILLESDDDNILKQWEIWWIKAFQSNNKEFGYNRTVGGDGVIGHKHSIETKIKIGAYSKIRQWTLEQNRKRSETLKGHSFSKETLLKITLKNRYTGAIKALYGVSEETKQKISKGISKALLGRKMSDETKLKLSLLAKAQWAKRKGLL